MVDNDYIRRKAAIDIALDWCPDDDGSVVKTGDLCGILDELEAIPAADVVPRKSYVELQAENCKLKNQVWSLKKKIKDMKSDASWDEDIRRGQVQGMW